MSRIIMFLINCIITGFMVNSIASEATFYDLEKADQLFEDFILKYEKTYANRAEKQSRLEIFKENLKTFNEKNAIGGAVFDINKFADLSLKEFEQSYMGIGSKKYDRCRMIKDNDISTNNAPASFNWQTKGAVTPVKNQNGCGSCWAFSTTGNIEGQYFIKNNRLLSFSEQQLVDCSERFKGCRGGYMSDAITDIIGLGGLETEDSYPYDQIRNETYTCRFDPSKVAVRPSGCTRYNLYDEDKLKEVLVNKGPISIVLFAEDLRGYNNDIVTAEHCPTPSGLHAVLLVGYGTRQSDGMDYWLFKNSWGPEYGEEGYFRLSRHENTCGMMTNETTSADL